MSRFARCLGLWLCLGAAAPVAAADVTFRLQGVVPVVCDAQPGRVAISGNRATIEIDRTCNTDHRLIVTWDATRLGPPEVMRVVLDGQTRQPGSTADAVFRAPAHLSGSRRLLIEAAPGKLQDVLRSLRIVVQPA